MYIYIYIYIERERDLYICIHNVCVTNNINSGTVSRMRQKP